MTRRALSLRLLFPLWAFAALPEPASALQAPSGNAPPFEVFEASIADLQAALSAGRVTSVELVDAYLARIRAFDQDGPALNAILHLSLTARPDAAAMDAERADGTVRGPLHGIPVVLKDNYDTRDMPTTGGSTALAGVVPSTDATIVARLREAGAVILGKTNMHEWAYGYTTISSLGGQTLNPYDPSRIPGGSSGGTAAAVAASFAAIGWGTDTCGSIRVPSALNGLFGLRPTKGAASINGIIPLAHTQDVPGPLARTATDLAVGLDITVGMDPGDPATAVLVGRTLPSFVASLDADALQGARIGILANYFGNSDADQEVGDLVRASVARMSDAGATVLEVELPDLDALLSGTSVITQEFRFDLMDYLASHPEAGWTSLTDILESGLYADAVEGALRRSDAVTDRNSESRGRALSRQEAARSSVVAFMNEIDVDALVYPTVRRPPAPVGSGQPGVACQLSAGTGLPALAVPAGLTADGLPAGFELLGRPFDDARLVAFAYAYEQAFSPRVAPSHTPPLAVGSGQ